MAFDWKLSISPKLGWSSCFQLRQQPLTFMLGNGFPCNALTIRGRALLDVESLILWGKNGGKQSDPKTHAWVKDAIWTKKKRTQFESKQVAMAWNIHIFKPFFPSLFQDQTYTIYLKPDVSDTSMAVPEPSPLCLASVSLRFRLQRRLALTSRKTTECGPEKPTIFWNRPGWDCLGCVVGVC